MNQVLQIFNDRYFFGEWKLPLSDKDKYFKLVNVSSPSILVIRFMYLDESRIQMKFFELYQIFEPLDSSNFGFANPKVFEIHTLT